MSLIYAASMSLDGYIAGPAGDMSWLTPYVGDPSPAGDRLQARTGCLLVGGRTHRGDDPNAGTDSEGAFGGTYDGPAVLLTRSADRVADVPAYDDVLTAVAHARELAGGRDVVVLGAGAAASCLDAGVLDEVLLLSVPVLLGAGVRALDRPGHPPVRLEPHPDEPGPWHRVLR